MKHGADFYTVLHMIDAFEDDDELIYLRKPEDGMPYRAARILTVREVKNKYDLRRTKVIDIRPYFRNGECAGLLLTIV